MTLQAQEMVVFGSSDKEQQTVSASVYALTGWSPEEYLARTEELVHPDDRDTVQAALRRCCEGEAGVIISFRCQRKGGGWSPLDAIVSGYLDPESQQAIGYVMTIRDGSLRRVSEETYRQRTEALLVQANTDQLTGLANRHAFFTRLQEESRRQARSGMGMALFMIDLDDFKAFNDRYGHMEGDYVLRQVGSILQRTANRVGDMVARFGGEEFVVLLPMTDIPGAAALAGKLQERMKAAAIKHSGSSFGYVTASIGISYWDAGTSHDLDGFLLEADRALYAAKDAGRNAVVIAQGNDGRQATLTARAVGR